MPSRKQEKSGTDAITLLKQDHEPVRQMFEEFEKADEDRKFELAAEICQALTVHAAIEKRLRGVHRPLLLIERLHDFLHDEHAAEGIERDIGFDRRRMEAGDMPAGGPSDRQGGLQAAVER